MSEITDVLTAIGSLSASGQRMALATIVAVRGSTYRRPGARLLVPEEGAPIGNISGGCLEGDVADMARLVMEEGRARLAGWDLTADDDAVWGLGLGCNGAIEVFIEPADRAVEAARALRTALEEERPISLVTVIESTEPETIAPGARLIVMPDGAVEGSLGRSDVAAEAIAAARELLTTERSEIRTLAEGIRAFVEILEPPLRLVICGAGHDAVPLVRAASLLGWNVTVVDDRPAFLNRERFPEAHGFAPVDDPSGVAEAVTIDARTFVVVMTHNFLRDKSYLRGLLTTDARYVAMLGRRRAPNGCSWSWRRGRRSRKNVDRASTARPAWTSAPKDRRRSPKRSSARSSRSGAGATAASSRNDRPRSTTVRGPELKLAPDSGRSSARDPEDHVEHRGADEDRERDRLRGLRPQEPLTGASERPDRAQVAKTQDDAGTYPRDPAEDRGPEENRRNDALAAVFRSQRLEQIASVLLALVGERERLDRLVHVPLGVPDRVGALLAREQIAARALEQFEDPIAVGWRRHR